MALARLFESRRTDTFPVTVWELGHYCPGPAAAGLRWASAPLAIVANSRDWLYVTSVVSRPSERLSA
jgi:hypothetical protein